jgi:hypothetical protein
VSLVEQERLPFRSTWIHPRFSVGFLYSIFSVMCMFCRSLFVLLYSFFWPLCCLFFFDLRILITPLVSSNSSYRDGHYTGGTNGSILTTNSSYYEKKFQTMTVNNPIYINWTNNYLWPQIIERKKHGIYMLMEI